MFYTKSMELGENCWGMGSLNYSKNRLEQRTRCSFFPSIFLVEECVKDARIKSIRRTRGHEFAQLNFTEYRRFYYGKRRNSISYRIAFVLFHTIDQNFHVKRSKRYFIKVDIFQI